MSGRAVKLQYLVGKNKAFHRIFSRAPVGKHRVIQGFRVLIGGGHESSSSRWCYQLSGIRGWAFQLDLSFKSKNHCRCVYPMLPMPINRKAKLRIPTEVGQQQCSSGRGTSNIPATKGLGQRWAGGGFIFWSDIFICCSFFCVFFYCTDMRWQNMSFQDPSFKSLINKYTIYIICVFFSNGCIPAHFSMLCFSNDLAFLPRFFVFRPLRDSIFSSRKQFPCKS